MPNEQDMNADELQLEVIQADESVEDTQNTTGEGESEEASVEVVLDNEQGNKQTPAELNAEKQLDAWSKKVFEGQINDRTGEPYEVEDAPKWLQPRLLARVDSAAKVPETEEVVKQVLEKEREGQEFKTLQSQIPKLTPSQAQELQDRYNALKPAGRVIALKAALDAMGLSEKVREAERKGIAKGKMSLPKSGYSAVKAPEQVHVKAAQSDKGWNDYIAQRVAAES
jgi:hypothetical protein